MNRWGMNAAIFFHPCFLSVFHESFLKFLSRSWHNDINKRRFYNMKSYRTYSSIPVSYTHLDVYKRQVFWLYPMTGCLYRRCLILFCILHRVSCRSWKPNNLWKHWANTDYTGCSWYGNANGECLPLCRSVVLWKMIAYTKQSHCRISIDSPVILWCNIFVQKNGVPTYG